MSLLSTARRTYKAFRLRRHVDVVKFVALSVRRAVPMWPALMTAEQLGEFKRVLVLAPHPDDEVFGMGGALLRLQRAGAHLRIVWFTNGKNEVRKAEAQGVREALGLSEPLDSAFPLSGDSVCVDKATEVVRQLIRAKQPDLVCVPSVLDPHPDHVRVGMALAHAIQQDQWQGTVLQYEVWGTVSPNVLLDISNVIAEKELLMRLYLSQLDEPRRKYVERILALNSYRGLTHQVEYAEGFTLLPSSLFAELV